MNNIQQFQQLQKKSSGSYHQQKRLIKNVLAGQVIHCEVCAQQLKVYLPEKHQISGIRCAKGCTDIRLDFS